MKDKDIFDQMAEAVSFLWCCGILNDKQSIDARIKISEKEKEEYKNAYPKRVRPKIDHSE